MSLERILTRDQIFEQKLKKTKRFEFWAISRSHPFSYMWHWLLRWLFELSQGYPALIKMISETVYYKRICSKNLRKWIKIIVNWTPLTIRWSWKVIIWISDVLPLKLPMKNRLFPNIINRCFISKWNIKFCILCGHKCS